MAKGGDNSWKIGKPRKGKEMTHQQIGDVMGCSAVAVAHIERRVMKKLREALADYRDHEFSSESEIQYILHEVQQ